MACCRRPTPEAPGIRHRARNYPDHQRHAERGERRSGHAEGHGHHGDSDRHPRNHHAECVRRLQQSATSQTIAVTVAGLPVIGVTTPTQTIGVGQADSIIGVSVSESGATTGEIFTVTLQDSNGVLSATDTGGTGNTVSSPGTTLTISGTLSEVNADLATLKDTDTTATPTDAPETSR